MSRHCARRGSTRPRPSLTDTDPPRPAPLQISGAANLKMKSIQSHWRRIAARLALQLPEEGDEDEEEGFLMCCLGRGSALAHLGARL